MKSRIELQKCGKSSVDSALLIWKLGPLLNGLTFYSILTALASVGTSFGREMGTESVPSRAPDLMAGDNKALVKLKRFHSRSKLLRPQTAIPRQSAGSFDLLGTLAGKDECPGQVIPPKFYTSDQPFVDTGDTTGANSTIDRLGPYYYYYYNYYWEVQGPDHVYTFSIQSMFPNAEIRVNATSPTFEPIVYVMDGPNSSGTGGSCPAGSGKTVATYRTLTFPSQPDGVLRIPISNLPLNKPLHLFIDSLATNAGNRSGPYTIRMQNLIVGDVPFTITGRVTTPAGIGLRNATVHITDQQGNRRTALTSSLGYYAIENIVKGIHQLGVASKRYRFDSREIDVNGNLANVDLVGIE